MSHRNGTCSSCGATYKIPPSFEHDKARCKECDGTVSIGPVEGGAPDSGPGLEPYVPSGKKRSGPSMRDQLLARRRAAAQAASGGEVEQAAHGQREVEQAADHSSEAPRVAPKPKTRPAPRTKAAPARKPARAAAESSTSSDDEPAEKGKPARRGSGKSSGRGSSSRRGGGRSRDRDEKKKSSMPMMIGIVGIVLLLGAGGFLFKDDLFGSGDVAAGETGADVASSGGPGGDAEVAGGGTDAPAGTEASDAAGDADGATDSEGSPAGDGEAVPTSDEPEAPPKKKYDPTSVDLSAIPDFAMVDGISAEEITELEAQLAFAMDPDVGVKQTRAQKSLEGQGRKAFPIILNYMKGLDYASETGCRNGMWGQRMLEKICSGANFGWKEYGEAAGGSDLYYEWFNKKAVQSWCKSWMQAETSLVAWARMAKLSEGELAALEKELGDNAPEESALDFLNED